MKNFLYREKWKFFIIIHIRGISVWTWSVLNSHLPQIDFQASQHTWGEWWSSVKCRGILPPFSIAAATFQALPRKTQQFSHRQRGRLSILLFKVTIPIYPDFKNFIILAYSFEEKKIEYWCSWTSFSQNMQFIKYWINPMLWSQLNTVMLYENWTSFI